MKDINLIPKRIAIEKKRKKEKVYSIIAIVFIATFLISGIVIPLKVKSIIKDQKNRIELQSKSISNYTELENQLRYIKGMLQERVDERSKLDKNGIAVIDLFEELERAATEKLFFTSFNASQTKKETQVSITGTAETEDDIATFVSYMRTSSICDNIFITSIKKIDKIDNKDTNIKPTLSNGKKGEIAVNIKNYYVFEVSIYLKAGK